MKLKFDKSYKLFYFQVRESPAPLNVPRPTPAPDRGGPVACPSGPVAYWWMWMKMSKEYIKGLDVKNNGLAFLGAWNPQDQGFPFCVKVVSSETR